MKKQERNRPLWYFGILPVLTHSEESELRVPIKRKIRKMLIKKHGVVMAR